MVGSCLRSSCVDMSYDGSSVSYSHVLIKQNDVGIGTHNVAVATIARQLVAGYIPHHPILFGIPIFQLKKFLACGPTLQGHQNDHHNHNTTQKDKIKAFLRLLLRSPGIEPGAHRCWNPSIGTIWQRWILPLNHKRLSLFL